MLGQLRTLLKSRKVIKNTLMVSLVGAVSGISASLLTLKMADNAHVSRVESYRYAPKYVDATVPIFLPTMAEYEEVLEAYGRGSERIDLQLIAGNGERESLAIRRLRTWTARDPIEGRYSSFWDLFRYHLVTNSIEEAEYHFEGWQRLADRDAVDPDYGNEDVFATTEVAYEQYRVNISDTEFFGYYTDPRRINPQRFMQTIESVLTVAIDQYVAVGAYTAAAELEHLRWEFIERYNVEDDFLPAEVANRLMLLSTLFWQDESNHQNYEDFRYLYDFISRERWKRETIDREFSSAWHQCVADFLNSAHPIHNRAIRIQPMDAINEIRDFRESACAEDGPLSDLATLLEMKATLVAVTVRSQRGDIYPSDKLDAVFRHIKEQDWDGSFRAEVFGNLTDDWQAYSEGISQHLLSIPVVLPEDSEVGP